MKLKSGFVALACVLAGFASAQPPGSSVGPVVEISQPARGQSNSGVGRNNPVDSVMNGGAYAQLPSSTIEFDRCILDDTQHGCANYCSANPLAVECVVVTPPSGNNGNGGGRRADYATNVAFSPWGKGSGLGGLGQYWVVSLPDAPQDMGVKVYVNSLTLVSGCGPATLQREHFFIMLEGFPQEAGWYDMPGGDHPTGWAFWGSVMWPDYCGMAGGVYRADYTVVWP
jgi:hypothetical protein